MASLSRVEASANNLLSGIVAKFDILGEGSGTILSAGGQRATQSEPPTPAGHHTNGLAPAADAPRKSTGYRPNKKQQLKHAMTVQSAHMITTDYVALSQPLVDGVLLNDRTDRKLKLIHSLGELQPMHRYTTEYGNVLERPSKHKAILAGTIELAITTDEADFDNELGKLALDGGSSNLSHNLPNTPMRMASYEAFSKSSQQLLAAGGGEVKNGHAGPPPPPPLSTAASGSSSSIYAAAPEADPIRLREGEAMQRVTSLVARLAEMEEWFSGVKAEAERERRMREQSVQRLGIMQERVELLHGQVRDLQKENRALRRRVADLSTAVGDDLESADGSDTKSVTPSTVGFGSKDVRKGAGSSSASSSRGGKRLVQSLSNVRGGLGM